MSELFVTIPSYADADLPRTIDSAIRSSSGQHTVHISVCEQVTRYAGAYMLGRVVPGHIFLTVVEVEESRLVGLGGALSLAQAAYAGEDIQVQVDAHVRFETDWDTAVVAKVDRAGPSAVISNVSTDPWYPGIPVSRLDRFQGGHPTGETETVHPASGRLDDIVPSRTIWPGAMAGRAWCDEVPADPLILFCGDDATMAARLWTHGRTLWHGRLPWYQALSGSEQQGGQHAWQHPDWSERDELSHRRAQALLTGIPLQDGDPAAEELDRYGLGQRHTLEQWLDHAGLDFAAETVRTPWP